MTHNLLVFNSSIEFRLLVDEAWTIAFSKKATRLDSFFGTTSSSDWTESILVRLSRGSLFSPTSEEFEMNPFFDEFESETFPESVDRDGG